MMRQTVNCDYRIPIVRDKRVPRGMAFLGWDKHGKLVYTVNLDKTVDPKR